LKVLHVLDSLNRTSGGSALSTVRLADAQVRAGAEVTILANRYVEFDEPLVPAEAGVRLLEARRQPLRLGAFSPEFSAEVEAAVRSTEFLHIHGLWLPTNRAAHEHARRLGKPRAVSPRGMLEPWAFAHRRARKLLAWALYEERNLRSSQLLHATSPEECEAIRDKLPTSAIAVLPNGVDGMRDAGDAPPFERLFPQTTGYRKLLFLSRIHRKKGLDLLLPAWKELEQYHPDWLLVIAGDDMDGELRRLRRDCASSERILVTGPLYGEGKTSALRDCEAFVLPSRSENFGHSIAEALAAGKPTITTTATPWREIASKDAGWIIEPALGDLREALNSCLLSPPSRLVAMGKNARGMITSRYDWSAIAEIMLQCYEWSAGRRLNKPSEIDLP